MLFQDQNRFLPNRRINDVGDHGCAKDARVPKTTTTRRWKRRKFHLLIFRHKFRKAASITISRGSTELVYRHFVGSYGDPAAAAAAADAAMRRCRHRRRGAEENAKGVFAAMIDDDFVPSERVRRFLLF